MAATTVNVQIYARVLLMQIMRGHISLHIFVLHRDADFKCSGSAWDSVWGKTKCKAYTAFTAEQRATIGKYASEHSNLAAMKKFKADFEGGQLGESTVHLFKKCYIKELKKARNGGASVP